MTRESTERRRLTDKEVINGLITHIDFFLFAADDPQAFGIWLDKNPQYQLSISLLNRLIGQQLEKTENLAEFLDAVVRGKTKLIQYLESHPELVNILKDFLSPVIAAANKWQQDEVDKTPLQVEMRSNLDEMINTNKAEAHNRALALANIIHLRGLFPGKDTVDINQFAHLFFFDTMPDYEKFYPGIRVIYDLINDNFDKSQQVFEMIALAKLLLYSSYSRIGAGMKINENEYSRRHEILQNLKEKMSHEDIQNFITVTDTLNDLNDYISTDQNYSKLQDLLYPQIDALKLLKKLLGQDEIRIEFGEELAKQLENRLSNVDLNVDNAENIIKIMQVYREVSPLCQLDQYSMIETVLKMQLFIKLALRGVEESDVAEKIGITVLNQYNLIDNDFKIRNLDDLLRVHQHYHVLSNTEVIREINQYKSELHNLEKAIESDDNHPLDGPVIHEISSLLNSFNQYMDNFIEADECYSLICSRIDEDIRNKNLGIYRKLLALSEKFPKGLRLEDFKFTDIPMDEVKRSIDKLNYYLVLIRSDLFNENDYKALFSVKGSHQTLLEKLTTGQGSELAYLIERCDSDDKQNRLLGLVEDAYRRPMKSKFDLVYKEMTDKNIDEYIKELKGLGKLSEVESFCRKIEKIVPGYFQSEKAYDTDISVKDIEHRKPIQSYAIARKSVEDEKKDATIEKIELHESNRVNKNNH